MSLGLLSRSIRITASPKRIDVRIPNDAYPIRIPTDPICVRTKRITSTNLAEEATTIIWGIIFVLSDATTIELSSLDNVDDPIRSMEKIIKV